MSEGFTCRGCGNLFFQAPKCVSCGAQKLYDSTVKGQWREIETQAARIAELEAALRQIEADCNADYPPSTGAIKYAARAALEGGKDEC